MMDLADVETWYDRQRPPPLPPIDDPAHELRVRRAFERRNLHLRRSRVRDRLSPAFRKFQIDDAAGRVVAGAAHTLTLDDAERWLISPHSPHPAAKVIPQISLSTGDALDLLSGGAKRRSGGVHGHGSAATILLGDALSTLRKLPDAQFQCVVSSPPYYMARTYSAGTKEIGKEESPQQYIDRLVAVFREVRRVLHRTGTVWLNLGDGYASRGGFAGDHWPSNDTSKQRGHEGTRQAGQRKTIRGSKYKDLMMLPHRVAIALQADGWWVRSAIVWHKPAVMPDPTQDRPTNCYEMIFLLAKSARYLYVADAIAEAASPASAKRFEYSFGGAKNSALAAGDNRTAVIGSRASTGLRNARNVWSANPARFRGAHYAVMPTAVAARCILAGSRPGDAVLDPFAGAGTTAVAALENGRSATLIELSREFVEIVRDRLTRAA